jgi:hypothetical protein
MTLVRDWIFGFLKRYKALIGPGDWPTGEDPDEMELFVLAWITQLGKMSPKATEPEADAALERLTLAPPEWRRQCIPAVVKVIQDMRLGRVSGGDDTKLRSPAELTAMERSTGCPECDGGGWARRHAYWHSIARPFRLDLFCRCSMGRFRKENDIELQINDRMRKHDDLQANPDLWLPGLSHPTWSDVPCEHDMIIDADCAGLWRYADHGETGLQEVAPGPELDSAHAFAPPPRPTRIRPDLGKVEPAVPIPPRPAPEPATATEPEPTVETTDDILEWL